LLNLAGKTFQAGDIIRVIDSNGAITKTVRLNTKTDKVTIDMTTLPPGLYFVNLAAGGERLVRKVIKR
ncbi:MAG: T9SS type A sorting domain-containing protein, partial [Cytophagales bacterium]|nr:T9SS type A sorting domain-containing protein [Cytophagales bacterium]